MIFSTIQGTMMKSPMEIQPKQIEIPNSFGFQHLGMWLGIAVVEWSRTGQELLVDFNQFFTNGHGKQPSWVLDNYFAVDFSLRIDMLFQPHIVSN